jgi:hypothetical protein
MPRTSLLLLMILILATAAVVAAQTKPSEPAPMIATAESLSSLSGTDTTQSFQLTPAEPRPDDVLAPSDDICYRIRAYIFKRDDDHAPEFVRSTTCGPRRPHEKNAVWPKAKLVPAN